MPSNIAVVGRYILTPAIFEKIENTGRGAGGEIQLTYDCGSEFGFLLANVEYGLLHPEIKAEFAAYLQQRASKI